MKNFTEEHYTDSEQSALLADLAVDMINDQLGHLCKARRSLTAVRVYGNKGPAMAGVILRELHKLKSVHVASVGYDEKAGQCYALLTLGV